MPKSCLPLVGWLGFAERLMLPRLIGVTATALGLAFATMQPALAESVLDRVSRTGRLNAAVMDGDLDALTDALSSEHQTELLAALAE